MFWYGFIGALAIISVQQSQIDLINFFFQQKTPYTLNPIPWWLVIGLGGIYFFVEEFLLQQAKYLWNDIRDQVWDLKNPSRQDRAFAKGNTVDQSDILHVIIRWTLALVFGYMLGGWQLFLVFMFISIHQAVYVLWGKPRGREHPIILLCIISLNIAPRFMVGVMAVSGTFPLTIPMLMLLAIFHFFSFGFMAAYWKMEAIDFANKKKQGVDVQERPQSEFFLSHGDDLQHQGFLGAIIVSLILLVGYFFSNQNASPAVSCYQVRSVSDLFLCDGFDGKLALTLLTLFILSIHLFSYYSRRVFGWLEKYITPIMLRIKTGMMLISYTIFFLGLIYVLIEKNKSIYVYFVAILFMNIGAFFMYEGMTWDGLMGLEVKRQIPVLIQLWLAYFFAPPETLDNLCLSYSIRPTMGNFLLITMKVLNNETVFLEGQHLPNFL
jgi:hypothetical protein